MTMATVMGTTTITAAITTTAADSGGLHHPMACSGGPAVGGDYTRRRPRARTMRPWRPHSLYRS
jgi:hypothetical protein